MRLFLLFLLLPIYVIAANLGTKEEPLEIESVQDLVWIRDAINSGSGTFKGVDISNGARYIHFKLMTDLDLSSVCSKSIGSWTPIGTEENPFNGNFDGNGKTIDYLYINKTSNDQSEYYGLFGYINNDVFNTAQYQDIYIQNLTLGEHSVIHVENAGEAGGIAGHVRHDVKILNCTNKGSIYSQGNAGGIVGYFANATGPTGVRISGSTNKGTISSSAADAGGIVGKIIGYYVYLDSCKNEGGVSANGYAAGIAGNVTSQQPLSAGHVIKCINTGSISSSATAAGIIANSSNMEHVGNFNSGNVQASNIAAGIIAIAADNMYGRNSQNVNAGDIFAGTTAGGIFGTVEDSKLENAKPFQENLNLGKISGMHYAGGIIGYAKSGNYTFTNNMNAGFIEGENEGGIVGYLRSSTSYTITVKSNLNVGSTDSAGINELKGPIIGYTNDEFSLLDQDSSINDKQGYPHCALSNTVICVNTSQDLSTRELTTENLPALLDTAYWEAKEGYYPELKALKNSALAEIASASALAITPVTFDSLNSIWNFSEPATTKATDGIGTTLNIASAKGGLLVSGTTITPYNAGFDTILVSNNVATKKIPVYNNIAGTLGTAENPLTIASVSELYAFKKAVEDSSDYKGVTLKNAGEGLYFKLTADLDLSKTCVEGNDSWQAIQIFSGSFNGGNHVISHMCINDDMRGSGDAVGLFANIKGAAGNDSTAFENVIFDDVEITSNPAYIVAGALVGRIITGNVVIRNNIVKNSSIKIEADSGSVPAYVGSILGMNLGYAAIYNNEGSATISVKRGNAYVGGILGIAVFYTQMSHNTSYVDIYADSIGGSHVGGITGQISNGIMEYNTNYGNIVAVSNLGNSHYAGIAGLVTETLTTTQENKNYGNIEIYGSQAAVGGIFGALLCSNTGSLASQENYGNISVTETDSPVTMSTDGVGGIAGFTTYNVFHDLKNYGTITVYKKSSAKIGGILGFAAPSSDMDVQNLQNDGSLKLEYASGMNSNFAFIGGIMGYAGPSGALQINDVLNKGNITILQDSTTNCDVFAAGIVGNLTATTNLFVANATNTGNIDAKTYDLTMIGGLFASTQVTSKAAQISNSLNTGSIALTRLENYKEQVQVGGLFAHFEAVPDLRHSANTGNITVNIQKALNKTDYEDFFMGGIMGELDMTDQISIDIVIQDVFNSGNIAAYNSDSTDLNQFYAAGLVATASVTPTSHAEYIANYGSIDIHGNDSSSIGGLFGYLYAKKSFEIKKALVSGAINADTGKNIGIGAFAGYATNASITSAIAYGSNGIAGFALDAIGATTLSNGSSTNTLDSIVFDQQMTAQENEDEINLYATTELTKLGLVDKLNEDDWVKKDNLYPELKIFAESESTFVSEISAIAATPIYLANTMDTTEYTNGVGYSFKVETSNSPLWESSVEGLVIEDSIANISGMDRDTFAVLTASSENASKQFFLRLAAHEKDTLDLTQVAWNYTDPFEYDGTEKTVTVTGLPEGVTAVYTNNSDSLPGSYNAEVSFIYNDTLYVKPAFDSTLAWEIEKKTITLDSIVWDYTAMFDYDSSAKTVSLKNVPEEIQVDYVNNVQSDSGRYVAQALLRYDSNKYIVEGDTTYELVWMISYDSTKVVASSSSEAESSSSSIVDEPSSSSEDAESSSSSEKVNIAMTHQAIAVQLVKNGNGNYTLNFANGSAVGIQIQVFDLMGNRIPVEINRNGSVAELKGLPQNSPSLIKVRGKSTGKTFKVL